MAAALADMSARRQRHPADEPAGDNPAAYPLTMVIYAMVPISGVAHTKAAAIARFLDFAAGTGQTPGVGPGQLPAGYLPLPGNLRAPDPQGSGRGREPDRCHPHARRHNRSRDGTGTGSGSSSPTPSPSTSPGGSVSLPGANPGDGGPPIERCRWPRYTSLR